MVTDQEAVDLVRGSLERAGALPPPAGDMSGNPGAGMGSCGSEELWSRRGKAATDIAAHAAASALLKESMDRGTMDNVTVVVMVWQHPA